MSKRVLSNTPYFDSEGDIIDRIADISEQTKRNQRNGQHHKNRLKQPPDKKRNHVETLTITQKEKTCPLIGTGPVFCRLLF